MNGLMNLTKLPPGFSWAHLQALYLLFPVGLITVWMLVQVDSWRKLFAPLMRAALLVLLVLALAGPERVATQEGETRPVLIDMSRSITPAMREWEQKLVKEDLHFRAADPVIAFGLRPSETTVGNLDKLRESPESCADCGLEGTDIEAALHKVAATVDSTGGPVVMITDGWENHGDAR